MIEALISSKTRIKLLLKFFLNSDSTSYLRGLESEFGESTNSIRIELNRFEEAGMLKSFLKGNKKYFQANTDHPLFGEVHNILLKYLGFDTIIDEVINRLGDVRKVYVVGEFAKGLDSNIIDLVFVGEVNKEYLIKLIDKVENLISRKVRYITYTETEYAAASIDSNQAKPLLLWSDEG